MGGSIALTNATGQPFNAVDNNARWQSLRKWHRVICEYERREEDRAEKKQQQQRCNNISNNTNIYNILQDDTLEEYGRYDEPWSLYTAASGNYCGKITNIKNRKTIINDIQVGVANNQSMLQIEEGELPFDRLPTAAKDVQVFPTMQGPLIGCGKLATNGCGIWFDNEKGSVVSGATKNKFEAIIATSGDDLLLAAPFDNQSLTLKTTVQPPRVVPVANNVQTPRVVPVPVPATLANNVHRLRTKEQLCDYLHRAAGHPVKKTWLAAIKTGEYATWPGLTYELVSNHLYDTEETAMGHLHKRRQNIRSTKLKPKPIQNTIEDLKPELQGQFFYQERPYRKSRGTPSRNGRSQWYDTKQEDFQSNH
jgi:hypothetical protein